MDSQGVLVVCSDEAARKEMVESIPSGAIQLHEATTGREAMALLLRERPSLVLTDAVLPDQLGLSLVREIRDNPELKSTRVAVVSAFASEMDRVMAFETGADDFIAQPFFRRELTARISALLRRGGGPRHQVTRELDGGGAIRLDLDRKRIEVYGERVNLTRKEFDLLTALVRKSGRVVSRENLIDEVWGPDVHLTERSVDAHIKQLRRKLGDARDAVETVRGVGYRFSV